MVRKFSALLLVVFVLITSTFVAFGATVGNEPSPYYSVFDFDYVASDRFTYPFVGGAVSEQPVYTYGRAANGTVQYIGTANYLSRDALSGQMTSVSTYAATASVSRWTFHSDTVYWDSGYVLKVYDYNDTVEWSDFTISFDIVDLEDSTGQYEVLSIPVTISDQLQGSMIMLHWYVNDRLESLGYDSRIVRLDNFHVTVEGSSSYYLAMATSVTDSATYGSNRAQSWLDEYDLPVPSQGAPVVATQFLTDILDPFLGFEIIPGVSLGAVLIFVATIALVFWFITLLV